MKEQIIQIELHDDASSVRDKMGWIRAGKVLLVLPKSRDHPVICSKLDLILIQREAMRRGAELGLITRDPLIVEYARELEIAHFGSIEDSYRLRWRIPKLSRLLAAPPTTPRFSAELVDAGTRLRQQRTLSGRAYRKYRRPLIAVACVLAVIGAVALIPGATIRVVPIANQTSIRSAIVADPKATQIDTASAVIPARIVGVAVYGTASVAATGTRDVPTDKAHGSVMLTNLVPDQVTVPAGTIVRTSAGQPVRFSTLADVTLAGKVGQNVEVGIEAVLPGFEGNLPSNKINQMDGPLGTRIAVTNPQPTQGGTVKQVQAVSQQDYTTVRALMMQQLQQRAYAEMQTDPYIKLLDSEFVPPESLSVVLVNSETYSYPVGEAADNITLNMQATIQGVAIDERAARQVVYAKMSERIGPGLEIRPESLLFKRGEVTGLTSDRRVTFIMEGAGDVIGVIQPAAVRSLVRGMQVRQAVSILQQDLPIAAPPTITVWPGFWPLIPIVPFRIQVETGSS